MSDSEHMNESYRIIKEQGYELTRLRAENEKLRVDNKQLQLGILEMENLRTENERLTKLIEDHMTHQENAVRAAMDETCDLYEQHCTCVPVLRAENEKLRAELKELKAEFGEEQGACAEAHARLHDSGQELVSLRADNERLRSLLVSVWEAQEEPGKSRWITAKLSKEWFAEAGNLLGRE